jgi:hypothetical protein
MAKKKRINKPQKAKAHREQRKTLQKRKQRKPKKPVKPVKKRVVVKVKPVSKRKPDRKKKGKPVSKKPVPKKGKPKKPAPKKEQPKKKGKPEKYIELEGKGEFYRKVKAVLWRNRRGDFANYAELIRNERDEAGKPIPFTSPAGKVYKNCTTIDCDDAEILAIYDSFTEVSEDLPKPFIPEQLKTPASGETNYWDVTENEFYNEIPEYVWIVSPMLFGEGVSFLAGSMLDRAAPGQEEEMRPQLIQGNKRVLIPFVQYMNELQKAGVNKYGYVVYREPFWNKQQSRWEVEIAPVTDDGTDYDYGYNPSVMVQDIPSEELPTADQSGVEKPEEERPGKDVTPPRSLKEIQAETELEKEKQKTLQLQKEASQAEAMKNILQMLNSGAITKAEAKEMMSMLK